MYSGTHWTDESLNRGVAVSFTVKLEVPAQVYILAIFTTFLFPLETPLRLSRNMLYGWKDNSMFAKPLAARTYLSSIVSELYDA